MKLQHFEPEQIETLSFDSVDWELIKTTKWLIENLPENAEILRYAVCNAVERRGTGKIENAVNRWFIFTIDGWRVSFEPSHNWLFEGIYLSAYKIINGDCYKMDCYSLIVQYSGNNEYFLELLSNPALLNSKQERINPNREREKARKDDLQEYITRQRRIEKVIYGLKREGK